MLLSSTHELNNLLTFIRNGPNKLFDIDSLNGEPSIFHDTKNVSKKAKIPWSYSYICYSRDRNCCLLNIFKFIFQFFF